jgi:type IV pilus assembly protein PilQ
MSAPRVNALRHWAPMLAALSTLAMASVWAAPQGASPAGAQASLHKYSGQPVSLDLQGADLRAVLRSLAELSGLNMVIDPSVKGSVDIKLTDVPWDQAFEMVLKSNKLGYIVDDSVVRVVPLAALAEEEADRKRLTDAQALAGATEIRTFALSYAEAAKLAPMLTKAVLSPRGQIQVDERTNTLIVSDLPARLATIADLVRSLDRAQPQVEIEARIIEADRNSARQLGIQWGVNPQQAGNLTNNLGIALPTAAAGTATTSPASPAATAGVNLAVSAATSGIGLAMGSIGGAFNLDVALSALETSGKIRILSTPRVTTQNNHEAEVTQGLQIPIQTVSNNTVTVTFKDAALKLTVTPQITAQNTVLLKVQIENSTPDFSNEVNGIPPINTQSASTQVQVNDGVTTVIGGILSSTESSSVNSTPGLSRIPLLGWLFKNNLSSLTSKELLIFITPRIMRSTP